MTFLSLSLLYVLGFFAALLAYNAFGFVLGMCKLVLLGFVRPKSFLTAFDYLCVAAFSALGSGLLCYAASSLADRLGVSATGPTLLAFLFPGLCCLYIVPVLLRVAGRDSRGEKTNWKSEQEEFNRRHPWPEWIKAFSRKPATTKHALRRQTGAAVTPAASIPPPLPTPPCSGRADHAGR